MTEPTKPQTEAGRRLARCIYDGTGPADDEVREVEQQAAAAERQRIRQRFTTEVESFEDDEGYFLVFAAAVEAIFEDPM